MSRTVRLGLPFVSAPVVGGIQLGRGRPGVGPVAVRYLGLGQVHAYDQRGRQELAHLAVDVRVLLAELDRDSQPTVAVRAGMVFQLVQRPLDVQQRPSAFVRHVLDPRRAARHGFDDGEGLLLADLAEVELQRRSGVPGGQGAGHLLRLVDVAERDVGRGRRQRLRRRRPVLGQVDAALRVAEGRALQVRVGHQQVHGVVAVPGAEVLDGSLEQVRVAGSRGRLVPGQVQGGYPHPGRSERQRRDHGLLAAAGFEQERPAAARAPGPAENVHVGARRQQRTRVEPKRIIVIAGDHDGAGAGTADAHQELVDQPLRVARRVAAVEHVAGVEDEVDRLPLDEAGQVVDDRLHLVQPLDALPAAADVPVAGVHDPHQEILTGILTRAGTGPRPRRRPSPRSGASPRRGTGSSAGSGSGAPAG